MSVLFFIGSCACHLWVLLLCFLVCFDVFGVLFFGNRAISWRADALCVEQSSEQLVHKGIFCSEHETGGPSGFIFPFGQFLHCCCFKCLGE